MKLYGARSIGALRSHLRYLERDGASREGERSPPYSTFSDDADGKRFLERCGGDRHQFRLIVSPDEGGSFDTLHSFTRELLARMERDLDTILDWIAVDHFDTGHPHTHVLMRGKTEEGKILQIAGDYIAGGIRARASEIMTEWLGPQNEMEVREQHLREIGAERLTALDQDMLARADDGVVDLRQSVTENSGGIYQQMLISRARVLERMGLAEREGPLVWKLDLDLERTLGDVARRGDIIRAMHDAVTAARLVRRPELFVIDRLDPGADGVTGQVVHRGKRGEHHNRCYLVVDGIDGRVHYVEDGKSLDVPVGSVIRIAPANDAERPRREPGVKIHVLSRHGPGQETTLCAPTWLDRQLRSGCPTEIAHHGFGSEVRRALDRRLQWLIEQGFAEQGDDTILYPADMDQRLRRAELAATVVRLTRELGLDYAEVRLGDSIAGVLRGRIDLRSGQFALMENSREFILVPWRPVLERYLGRELSGIVRASGSVSWRNGRERQGPDIGI